MAERSQDDIKTCIEQTFDCTAGLVFNFSMEHITLFDISDYSENLSGVPPYDGDGHPFFTGGFKTNLYMEIYIENQYERFFLKKNGGGNLKYADLEWANHATTSLSIPRYFSYKENAKIQDKQYNIDSALILSEKSFPSTPIAGSLTIKIYAPCIYDADNSPVLVFKDR